MASSAWFPTSNDNIVFQIRAFQNSQDIANNTSNVTVEVWVKRTNTGYTTYGTGSVACSIQGTVYTQNIDTSDKITSTAIKIFSKTTTVSHHADGTQVLETSAHINHSQFTASSHSYDYTLTTIPRASTPSFGGALTLGGSVTINTNRLSTGFTHNLYYYFGNASGTIATGVTDSCVWTAPISLCNETPTAMSGVGTIRCDTYSGSTLVGSKNVNFTASVPAYTPTLTGFVLNRVDNDVPSDWGIYVQGHSGVHAVIGFASGVYGSSISKFSIVGGGSSGSGVSLDVDALMAAGENVFTAVVTDTRGKTATANASITVEPYSNPNIASFSAVRCLSDGTPNDDGTYVKVNAVDSISSVAGKNSATRLVQYRKAGDTAWTNAGAYASGVDHIIGAGAISTDYAYEVMVTLTDVFTSVNSMANISTAFTTMDFRAGGKGMAIGKVSEKDALEIAMPTEIIAPLTIDSINAVDSDYSGADPLGKTFAKLIRPDGSTMMEIDSGYFDDTFGIMGLTFRFFKPDGSETGSFQISENGEISNEFTIPPDLLNNWIDYSSTEGSYAQSAYWKDKNGVVHLRGLIKGGTMTAGTVLFNLPVGYRPLGIEIFNVMCATGYTRVDVQLNGNVVIYNALTSNSWISLAGITFKAEG